MNQSEFDTALDAVVGIRPVTDRRPAPGRSSWGVVRGRILDVAHLSPPDEAAWRDLAQRAVEPNPFYEPDCLIPAARHQTFGAEIQLVVAEDGDRFYGVLPIRHVSRWHKLRYPIVTTQVRRMIYQGTPLIDAERGIEAARALLEALVQERGAGKSRVLALQELTDGVVAEIFRDAALGDGPSPLRVRVLRPRLAAAR